ncbi:tail fiber protein [uncultured phage MedDCM-OCT-S46-C10]|uniref:DUF7483 domain-containing protein n=1 Tax=uncultured phage MedDCM-OCT-S46-C10 TaxID=2741074 RepID=A0A6S4PCX4_9CAUD|nr:tail fiber protein [uncultured phage_MedDCM-OCT-S46-C10]BAQ94287.1 hypothetical protein [uncultured phage_MedDCM-OCT-S46-C10]
MAYTTINKSGDYFNTQLWTGNSTANRSLTGFGFQPDFVWIKNRDTTRYHVLMDAVRGASKIVYSNESDAEVTDTNQLESFDSDGITVGTDNNVNKNGSPHVGWTWKANGTGSANTDGSINSTVSVNTTAGFSIVKYYGDNASTATIGHGLGVAPEMIISKNISTSSNADWTTYHKDLDSNKNLFLNSTSAQVTPSYGTITGATNLVINVSKGSGNQTNSSHNFIMYCFAPKTGYSKFGSYTGNGNADGTFVYTGFKPAFVIYKRYDSGSYSWVLVDNKRNTFNAVDKYVHPNISATEGTVTLMDFLSNGFKMRVNDATSNQGSIIYMAFASAPLVGTNNVPCTAR